LDGFICNRARRNNRGRDDIIGVGTPPATRHDAQP
jgi:hypothetical protein